MIEYDVKNPKYGYRWYLYFDGEPPEDDDNDYRWTGFQWVKDNWEDRKKDNEE